MKVTRAPVSISNPAPDHVRITLTHGTIVMFHCSLWKHAKHCLNARAKLCHMVPSLDITLLTRIPFFVAKNVISFARFLDVNARRAMVKAVCASVFIPDHFDIDHVNALG